MPTEIESEVTEFRDWVFRYRPANISPRHLVIMLHGWTGDENSMWLFTRNIPERTAILAPRAPFIVPEGGYSWRGITEGTWGYPTAEDLRPSAEALLGFVDDWSRSVNLDFHQFELVGFSQGTMLSYLITILHTERVRSLTALSGFIPGGAEALFTPHQLDGKQVFVAHGRQDDMVAVKQARASVKLLENSGAQVTYCESDGGHKVSKECMGGMETFFMNQFN